MRWFIVLILLILISGCANEKVSYGENTIVKENKYGGIGSKIVLNGISYTVERVESYSEIGETTVSKKANGVFYLVYFKITNLGDHSYFFSPKINIVDSSERRYSPDLKASFYLSNLIEWDKSVEPGESHSGVIVFDIPVEEKELELEVHDFWEKVERVYITMPETSILRVGVSPAVLKAREDDELLRAGMN